MPGLNAKREEPSPGRFSYEFKREEAEKAWLDRLPYKFKAREAEEVPDRTYSWCKGRLAFFCHLRRIDLVGHGL